MKSKTEGIDETTKTGTSYTVYKLNDALKELLDCNNGFEISTYINGLENALNRLRQGEVSVIFGRSLTGKSILLKNIIRNVCCNDNMKVGVICFEHSRHGIIDDIVKIHGGDSVNAYRHYNRYGEQFEPDEVYSDPILDEVSRFEIYFIELYEITCSQYFEAATQLCREHNINVLVIDHIRCLCSHEQSFNECKCESLTIMQNIKSLARRLSIPILVSMQLPGIPCKDLADIEKELAVDFDALKKMSHYVDNFIEIPPVGLSVWKLDDNKDCLFQIFSMHGTGEGVLRYSFGNMRFSNTCEEEINEQRELRKMEKDFEENNSKIEKLSIQLVTEYSEQRIQVKDLKRKTSWGMKDYLEQALMRLEKEGKVEVYSEKKRTGGQIYSTHFMTFK